MAGAASPRASANAKASARRSKMARSARSAAGRTRFRPLRFLLRWTLRLVVLAVLIPALWVLSYRWIDPPGGYYMASERLRLGSISRDWIRLDEMSSHLPRAAVAAEDARFCAHFGFDIEAIRAALKAAEEGRGLRGASTISQQVAKNVFLWHGRSWLRKGLEAGFTLLIEALWPKDRIVEVYLNVAEFDEGVFGVEAAARHHFGKSAAALTLTEASRLAAILPAPKTRDPANPSRFVRRRAASIADGAETIRRDGRAACLAR